MVIRCDTSPVPRVSRNNGCASDRIRDVTRLSFGSRTCKLFKNLIRPLTTNQAVGSSHCVRQSRATDESAQRQQGSTGAVQSLPARQNQCSTKPKVRVRARAYRRYAGKASKKSRINVREPLLRLHGFRCRRTGHLQWGPRESLRY